MSKFTEPEIYRVQRTKHCPNNILPILVYRKVLPEPYDEVTASEFLQANEWVKQGTWGTITTKHYHPNTHECYGIFHGSSTLIFGLGGRDTSPGIECPVSAGDVVVVPAGVAHASTMEAAQAEKSEGTERYRYIGVYPKEAPKWRNEYEKEEVIDGSELFNEIGGVQMPYMDPVFGVEGPLVRIWREVTEGLGAS